MLRIVFYLLLNIGVMLAMTLLVASAGAAPVPMPEGIPVVKPLSQEAQSFIDGLRQRQQTVMKSETPPVQTRLFVSLSMPEAGLKTLMQEAVRFHIPVTLRGLVNNDLRQTANALLPLVREENRGGVQIDPRAFRQCGVTAVPLLVVTCEGQHDRLAGTLSVSAALRKIAEQGDCAPAAQALLDKAEQP